MSNEDLWQDLHVLLQGRQVPTEWIKVPSHVGLYGNGTADKLAGLGVQKHGVRMQGQEQQTPKRQAGWARDRGYQELGTQGLAPEAAATGRDRIATLERPHAGGGMLRLMCVIYVGIEEHR